VSAINSANAQAAGLRNQAAAARYNQQVAGQNAEAVRAAGEVAEEQQRKKNVRLLGAQQAMYAGSGVTLEGTPLEVMAQTAGDMEFDILASRYNTEVQARRWESQGRFYGFEADRSLSMADNAGAAGILGAGTTILTGASRALSGWNGGGGSSEYQIGGRPYLR